MRKTRAFAGVMVLGCLLLIVPFAPAMGEEGERIKDTTALEARIANLPPRSGGTEGAQTEAGAALGGRATNMFLVDGANGGTIYFYNYELRQIIRTCPTPETADGISADGLAVANDRASLFYTNSNGSKLIYEIDVDTCAVIQTIDSALASGGTSSGFVSRIEGLGYGINLDPFRRDGDPTTGAVGPNVVWVGGLQEAEGVDRVRCFDPDNAAFGWTDSFGVGAGGFEYTAAGDMALPITLTNSNFGYDLNAEGAAFTQGFGGLTLVLTYNIFTFADYWLPDDQGGTIPDAFPATGQGFVSIRGDKFDPGVRVDREYHTTLGAGFGGLDTIYEYDATVQAAYGSLFFRSPLQSVADPTPGDQVSAMAVSDLDNDFDGIPDIADGCPDVRSTDTTDGDNDTIPDACDNCPADPNLDQADSDVDGAGDACDLIYDPAPLPAVAVWLTDGFEGGTIYEYDAATGTIRNSFATPEINVGMGQGLAYSQRNGELFYTNGTGPAPTLYALSPVDGAELRSIDTAADRFGSPSEGIGVGQLGNLPVFGYDGGGSPHIYSAGGGLLLFHDINSLAVITGAGLGGTQDGSGAAAAAEDNTNEAALGLPAGMGYFTRNGAGDQTGDNRLDTLSWEPFGVVGRRFYDVTGVDGVTGIGLGFDGTTYYLSKTSVDGLFTYDIFDYFAEFGTTLGLLCDGGDNDGADCATDADCPNGGACVDASVRAHLTDIVGFIPDPTPGGPITGVAASAADADLDGVANVNDNCATIANPGQDDADQDGIGDACDNCPATSNSDQLESELFGKFDGVGDVCDNCFELFNPGQEDDDGDGLGNVCDFAPGFVDDSDAFDATFGPDIPAPPLASDIAIVSTVADICDFSCSGGPDVCCGLGFGNGEEALIVTMGVIGNQEGPALDQGTFELDIDFCEDEAVGTQLLSICETALVEPGVGGHDTQDVVVTAKFGQSTGNRGGGRSQQGTFNGLARVENLSLVNQVDRELVYVLPISDLAFTANPAEQAASGLDQDPLGSVRLGLWFSSRSSGNQVDRAPNTDDNNNPTILEEISLFTAEFRQLFADPDALDFRGTTPCSDTDRVVINSGASTSFTSIINPSFQPMTLTDVQFSDPQFSLPVALPITIPELGGTVAVTVAYAPTSVGTHNATATLISQDPTPETFSLVGEGLPNDPPMLPGTCDIIPSTVFLGQAPIFHVDVTDSATLANVSQCTAIGTRIAGGTMRTVFLPPLVDDGSAVGDASCDGQYTQNVGTGGLFGRGTWEFTFECTDKQGNSSGTLVCPTLLEVQ